MPFRRTAHLRTRVYSRPAGGLQARPRTGGEAENRQNSATNPAVAGCVAQARSGSWAMKAAAAMAAVRLRAFRSEEHTSELQSLMRISYAVFCLKKKTKTLTHNVGGYSAVNNIIAQVPTGDKNN